MYNVPPVLCITLRVLRLDVPGKNNLLMVLLCSGVSNSQNINGYTLLLKI